MTRTFHHFSPHSGTRSCRHDDDASTASSTSSAIEVVLAQTTIARRRDDPCKNRGDFIIEQLRCLNLMRSECSSPQSFEQSKFSSVVTSHVSLAALARPFVEDDGDKIEKLKTNLVTFCEDKSCFAKECCGLDVMLSLIFDISYFVISNVFSLQIKHQKGCKVFTSRTS